MDYISHSQQLRITCKFKQMWGVYVNVNDGFTDPQTEKALRDMLVDVDTHLYHHVVVTGELGLFDTEKEAREFYNYFEKEPLANSCVYACLISPTEGTLTENT